MPFRLTNAPATFQRLVEICLGDLNLHWCIIYSDDIVIFPKDLVSHPERVEALFQKLEKAGLKLRSSKWELFQWKIAYLGHVISSQRVATDEGMMKAKLKLSRNGHHPQMPLRSKVSLDSWDITLVYP